MDQKINANAKLEKAFAFVRKAVNADGIALPRVSGGYAYAV